MACTIDHLRVDHCVTVLRDFTDLGGVIVRSGETAQLRGLGFDSAAMEVWIELERSGGRDRLRFALRAPDGPRIGHMIDYFAMGAPIAEPAGAVPLTKTGPAPDGSAEGPARRPPAFANQAGTQPPNDTSLGAHLVACDCDPAFQREVLSARGELAVHACLSCGAVTCSRSIGDDGRFTGDAWQDHLTVALPTPVLEWISGWPRVKVDYAAQSRWPMSADLVRYPTIFYPADLRVGDVRDLVALDARLSAEQAGRSVAERLRASHRVDRAPPEGLPETLRGYRMLWEALQLRPESELAELLHHAQPRSPGSEIAAESLRQRPDVIDVVADSLRSGDPARRRVGFVIARDLRPVDPRVVDLLVELLGKLSLDPADSEPSCIAGRSQGELLLLLVAELRLARPEVLATLRVQMRKFARHDEFLARCTGIVLRELEASRQGLANADRSDASISSPRFPSTNSNGQGGP